MASQDESRAVGMSPGALETPVSGSKRESTVSLSRALHGRLTATSSRPPSLSVPDYTHISTHEGIYSLYQRPSRASSIISTRTKTSITTLQDDGLDGFDIRISQDAVYRIGLDGRIIYVNNTKGRLSSPSDAGSWEGGEERGAELRTSQLFLSTSAADLEEHTTDHGPSRNPSFKPGMDSLSVAKRRSSSSAISPRRSSTGTTDSQLRRRGGVKLKLVTRHSSGQVPTNDQPVAPGSASSYQTAASRHSQPSSPEEHIEPVSPKDMGSDQTRFPLTVDDTGFTLGRWPEASSADFSESVLGHGTQHISPDEKELKVSPRPVLHIHTRDHTADRPSGHAVVAESPVEIEHAQSALHIPAAAHVDIHAHYNRLMRGIEANHERRIRRKEEELGRARDMLESLARQAVDLKAELIRTRTQVASMSDPAHIRKLAREQSAEAQSFSFPPLKLSHVRTLKTALKRRAEKMRKNIDDDLGWRVKVSVSSSDGNAAEVVEESGAAENLEPNPAGPSNADPISEFDQLRDTEEKSMVESLLSAKRRIRAVETEQQILEAQVINLRHAISHWMDRCHHLEKQAIEPHSPMVPDSEMTVAIMQAKHEVEQIWDARWRDRAEQLNQRNQRIETEAQKALTKAVADKDACEAAWRKKCELLLATLKDRDDELAQLKGGPVLPGDGFWRAIDRPCDTSHSPISPRAHV